MAGVRIEFAQFGDFDSFNVYRSSAPMNTNNMPAPIATELMTMYYVDATVVKGEYYYYRVGVNRATQSELSDEIFIEIPRDIVVSEVPTDYILAYNLNGELLDKSVNALNGIKSGSTTFIAGRKEGTQALSFSDGGLKTPAPLVVGSDKFTFSAWLKTTQTSLGVVFEIPAGGSSNTLAYIINGQLQVINEQGSSQNSFLTTIPVNNIWVHVLIEMDRSRPGPDEVGIFINNTFSSAPFNRNNDLTDGFSSMPLSIGATGTNAGLYVGGMQDIRVYNRILSENERLQLFNE